ncbi:hypothetical protein [Streptosporangium sandarakinum]|uniref:Uncharacterized protein n=1 Tax=Streptosporangium sandarakinum TaxID=1260955 RepID=A0A852UMA0_9ACTN|nr:hypothetical protein [Streptosporangium sandarakinum]NYF38417.1 hypothetical protein [Streptosporangium sandarakinum]
MNTPSRKAAAGTATGQGAHLPSTAPSPAANGTASTPASASYGSNVPATGPMASRAAR